MTRITRRLSYGNVVATLALFIALGGTSYAVTTITSKNVANNTLTSADVRNESLTGKDVKDRSLSAADFGGPLPAGARGAAGAQGAQGGPGPQGPAGPAGAAGAAGRTGDKGDKGDRGETGDIFSATTLPSGKSLRGAFNMSADADAAGDTMTSGFGLTVPLASDPEVRIVGKDDPSGGQCPGTRTNPKAAPGFLCLYVTHQEGAQTFTAFGIDGLNLTRFGATLWATATAVGPAQVAGTWAVTAP